MFTTPPDELAADVVRAEVEDFVAVLGDFVFGLEEDGLVGVFDDWGDEGAGVEGFFGRCLVFVFDALVGR